MDWQKNFSGKFFISDLGDNQRKETDGRCVISRYAAWAPVGGNNHQIVEISDDLPMLMDKYNVPQDRVCILI